MNYNSSSGGSSDPATRQQTILEAKQYGDVLVADFLDSYNNLTIKSTLMLKYLVEDQIQANYVIKADDDTYINVDKLIEEFNAHLSNPPRFYCRVYFGSRPVRQAPNDTLDSKWVTPHWMYPWPRFPPYCAGAFYAFDGLLANQLYQVAMNVPLVSSEDLYITGLVRIEARYGIYNNVNVDVFDWESRQCDVRNHVTALANRQFSMKYIDSVVQRGPNIMCYLRKYVQNM